MGDKLANYDLDQLAVRVEGGSDSDGQKAEPILVAKAMVGLQSSVKDLQLQIIEAGKGIRTTFRISLDRLEKQIEKYSESSSKQAEALKRLTLALVVVGFLQVIVGVLQIIFRSQ